MKGTSKMKSVILALAAATTLNLCCAVPVFADAPSTTTATAMRGIMKKHAARSGATIYVDPIIQEGNFVVAGWITTDSRSAGEALAKVTSTKIVLLNMSGGSLNNLAELERLGVPETEAKALVADLTSHHL